MKPIQVPVKYDREYIKYSQEFDNAYASWKISGNAVSDKRRYYFDKLGIENAKIVFRNGNGYAVACDLTISFPPEHEWHRGKVPPIRALSGKHRYAINGYNLPEFWEELPKEVQELIRSHWNGYYYIPMAGEVIKRTLTPLHSGNNHNMQKYYRYVPNPDKIINWDSGWTTEDYWMPIYHLS